MLKVTGRTVPWAILLAVIFASVVLYFAAMLEVIGQISKEKDELERLSRSWLGIELTIMETSASGSRTAVGAGMLTDFQLHLSGLLDLPWFLVLNKAYPELRIRSEALRTAVLEFAARGEQPSQQQPYAVSRAKDIEKDLDSVLSWIGNYSVEQLKAFRVLLVLLAASMVLGAVLVLGIGNLVRLQEARFLAAVDSMSDALILTDAANIVIHVNPAACVFLNATAGSLEGKSPPAFFTGAAMRERPAIGPQDGSTAGVEALLTDSAGRRRAVSLKVEKVREASGRIRGSVYLVRDLTEWKKLVASIASTFVSLQIEDANSAVTRAIDEAASLCGAEIRALLLFGTAEGLGASGPTELADGLGDGVSPGIGQWVRRAAQIGEPVFRAAETADGEDAALIARESLAWIAAIPLRFAGTVTGAIALGSRSASPAFGDREMAMQRIFGSLVIELLSKKWAMREMNRLGFEYRELIDHANVPIWGVDIAGLVNEWNRAIALLTGLDKSRVLRLPAVSLIDSEPGRDQFVSVLGKVLAGERIADKELRIQADTGEFSTLLVSGSPRLDFDGRVAGAMFIGQDISARVAGERRIKEQARALVEVQDIERLRISRELHDNVAQDLSAARIACETLFDGVDGDESSLRRRVAQLSEAITSSLQAIRGIAYDMRPLDAAGKGLAASLSRLCVSFGTTHPLAVSFQSAGADGITLPTEHAVNIYRIVQESLANAWRHARARSVNVTLVHSHPELILRVIDDGVGFDVEQKCTEAADRQCMGLIGMRERAAILGAALHITSRAGKGTQVKLTMPLEIKEGPDGPATNHSPRR